MRVPLPGRANGMGPAHMQHLDPELLEATFDRQPDAAAILDGEGRILRVNQCWRDFSSANEGSDADQYQGWNYLHVCRGAGEADPDAAAVAGLLQELLEGRRDVVSFEYPCHAPDAQRWFLMRAARMEVRGDAYAVVAHIDITQRRLAENELARRAERDELTGLLGRDSFSERLQQALNHARRREHRVALRFLDLDGFKAINDQRGHAVGDALLRTVADRLREHFRAEDAAARFGGDEFVLFAEFDPGQGALETLLTRLGATLSAPLEIEDGPVEIRCSIGASVFPADGETPDALVEAADAAMYRAKDAGGGIVLTEGASAETGDGDEGGAGGAAARETG